MNSIFLQRWDLSPEITFPQLKELDSKKDLGNAPPPPPDGGWGWVIVAASFLCNMVGVVHRKIILDNPCFITGAGWDWLLIWDLCETTGGSLRGSWERQNLIGENLDQQNQHLLIFLFRLGAS